MKYAKINNIIKNISDVKRGEEGICPVCNSHVVAKKGVKVQYFAHRKGEGNNCKYKYESMKKNTYDIDKIFKNKYNNINIKKGFTREQLAIINSKDNNILVSAVAGSGKTRTLQEYTKRNPNRRILYLVYNKSMQLEAKERFKELNNVEVRTIHSLAYKNEGYKYRSKLTSNLSVFDMAKSLNMFIKKPKEFELMDNIIEKVHQFNTSTYYNLKKFCKDNECMGFYSYLNKYFNNPKKVTHDYYLKQYQKSKPKLDYYDDILVDEVQDINGSLLSIIKDNKNNCKMILVGDSNQSIYGFAGNVNAFKILGKEWKRYTLTNSFRVGNSLAKLINVSFKDIFNKKIDFVGVNNNQKVVKKIDRNKKHYTLCRTNSQILDNVIPQVMNGDKIYVEGGLNVEFKYIKDLLKFYNGKSVFRFNSYRNYDHLKNVSLKTKNLEFISANNLINKYGNELLLIIEDIKNNIVKNSDRAKFLYSTIHKSKGKDIEIPLRIEGVNDLNNYIENGEFDDSEMNVLYVALTRAKSYLEIPQILL